MALKLAVRLWAKNIIAEYYMFKNQRELYGFPKTSLHN